MAVAGQVVADGLGMMRAARLVVESALEAFPTTENAAFSQLDGDSANYQAPGELPSDDSSGGDGGVAGQTRAGFFTPIDVWHAQCQVISAWAQQASKELIC